MPKYKFSLKSGKTLEYKNGKWYYDGKHRSTRNFTLVDIDGYYKSLMPDGSLAIKDVDEKGNPIKPAYIGGTTKEARAKYWKQAPIMRHAVDSIANSYGISPRILRQTLDREGATDHFIRNNNYDLHDPNIRDKRSSSNYYYLNNPSTGGFIHFGLDDVSDMINSGDVNLINENWSNGTSTNEKGRTVHPAEGKTTQDNIGISAATLKYFRNKAATDFPNASRIFLDEAAGVYYNRGVTGGRKYMKSKKK